MKTRPRSLRAWLGITVFGLVIGATSIPPVPAADAAVNPNKMSYIAIPHPDDEMQAWSLIEESPDNYKVFILLTRGEQSGYCNGAGYAAGTGEIAPSPWPGGKWSTTCADARVNSLLAFLKGMGTTDSGLPSSYTYQGVKGPFSSLGLTICRRDQANDASCTVYDRTAKVWTGTGAAVVAFNLGDGDLARTEVEWAIKTVRDNRSAMGINSSLPNHNLLGGSFSNISYSGCYVYTHQDHRAVHEALWQTDFNVGTQLAPSCASDPDIVRSEAVSYSNWHQAFQVSGTTRVGEHVTHYGWLAGGSPGYWPGDYSGQDELFHRDQEWWARF